MSREFSRIRKGTARLSPTRVAASFAKLYKSRDLAKPAGNFLEGVNGFV